MRIAGICIGPADQKESLCIQGASFSGTSGDPFEREGEASTERDHLCSIRSAVPLPFSYGLQAPLLSHAHWQCSAHRESTQQQNSSIRQAFQKQILTVQHAWHEVHIHMQSCQSISLFRSHAYATM